MAKNAKTQPHVISGIDDKDPFQLKNHNAEQNAKPWCSLSAIRSFHHVNKIYFPLGRKAIKINQWNVWRATQTHNSPSSSKHPIKPKTVKKVSMKVTNSPILDRRSKTVETRWFDSKPSRLHGNKLFKLCESRKLSRIPPHVSFWLCLFLLCYMLGCYESVQYL